MRSFGLLLLLGCLSSAAHALITPTPGERDPRIQSIVYDPDEVYLLEIPMGYATTIEIASDERVENLVVGNAAAWQVVANKRADHIIIKPLQNMVSTNLVVITDARYYSFQLTPQYAGATIAPFLIKFQYPPPATEVADVKAERQRHYKMTGDRRIWPSSIVEDQGNISMEWPPEAPIPAIFGLNALGYETLLTGRMTDGRMVLDGMADRYVFRLGKTKATATLSRKAASR